MNWLLKVDNWIYYFALCGICLLFLFIMNHFLYTDDLYYASFGEQYTAEQIRKILDISKPWRYMNYIILPLIIVIRILYTSLCLFIGDLVQESHWKFKSLFNISLKADAAFCISYICNFYYYILTQDYRTLDDLGINCFSLLKWIGRENIPSWLFFAFNSINFFELLYIILLIVLLRSSFRLSYLKSTIFIFLTYVIGNYFYIVSITFIYLNFS